MRPVPDLYLPVGIASESAFIINADGRNPSGNDLGYRMTFAKDATEIGVKMLAALIGPDVDPTDGIYATLCTMLAELGQPEKWTINFDGTFRWKCIVDVDNGWIELSLTTLALPDVEVVDPRPGALINHLVTESRKYGFVPITGMVEPDTWGKIVELVVDSEGSHISRRYPEGDNSWEVTNWFEATTDVDEVLSINVGYVGCERDDISYITGHWVTQPRIDAEVRVDGNGPGTLLVWAIGKKADLFSAINLTSERLNMVSTDMGAALEAQEAAKGVDAADAQ
ncbi:hypothetical protein [Mesorhizobium sp. M8A.F.Ca.ET.021.01.1.1]|uniref:hypothetical protein n=1 Tax=Mesorhizobium sp. M8A.F.Ca.ET.021.01.1.1 TaxID=2496757 RepID=UPI000FCA2AD1|nr:hypothetical protein [Mesorhizobium sp. M8A.F.Ca.ET.021.01.1.1]RUW56816.1 hypothetical protein EOA36_02125 [Mesorhizobium sp. M8A.F.Ca.ET.021.01.1.1]